MRPHPKCLSHAERDFKGLGDEVQKNRGAETFLPKMDRPIIDKKSAFQHISISLLVSYGNTLNNKVTYPDDEAQNKRKDNDADPH